MEYDPIPQTHNKAPPRKAKASNGAHGKDSNWRDVAVYAGYDFGLPSVLPEGFLMRDSVFWLALSVASMGGNFTSMVYAESAWLELMYAAFFIVAVVGCMFFWRELAHVKAKPRAHNCKTRQSS
ncbi:MAG: hypothetical protein GY862_27000 [Gammaproteobacteria bacterium]|nr:hypothetical protein [Gammaproteobacteria bacterium]MCP5013843.1 hypothetical protein [Ketobacter sp.]